MHTKRFHGNGTKFPRLYRFLSSEKYANDFAQGSFRVSTIQACRDYPDPLQGDPGEATHIIKDGDFTVTHGDTKGMERARNIGVNVREGATVKFNGPSTRVNQIPNAYLLCTTEKFEPEKMAETFGKHCVEITDTERFMSLVHFALADHTRMIEAAVGRVKYDKREFTGLEIESGTPGFVKPLHYAEQEEVRFLWLPYDLKAHIVPVTLNVPEVASMVRRVL